MGLNKTITRWQGMGLMATTLLGTGVFILPQLTIATAGDRAIWTWCLLIIAMLPLAIIFAELGRRFPSAAGPAFFLKKAFGTRSGHVIGLMFISCVPIGAPAALIMTFEFLKPFVELSAMQSLISQIGIIFLLFFLNFRGLKMSGKIQLFLTLTIVAVVLLMLAAFILSPVQVDENIPAGNNSGMISAFALAIWSFLGIEAITHLSAEFKDAERDFMPAVIGGMFLVGTIYIGCTYLSMTATNSPLAMVGAYEQLLGNSGRWIIGILGFASGIATVNIYFASVARLIWSLSNDGVLPKLFKPLNEYNSPSHALLAVQLLSIVFMLLAFALDQHFEVMMRWTNGVFVCIYTASMFAAWRLVNKRFRPIIIAALIVCLMFVLALGSSIYYAVVLAIVYTIWINIQKRFLGESYAAPH